MKTLRYAALLALCLAPLATAQDAEPFDPYKAYQAGDVEAPLSQETIDAAPVEAEGELSKILEDPAIDTMQQYTVGDDLQADEIIIFENGEDPSVAVDAPEPAEIVDSPAELSTEITDEFRAEDGTLLGQEELTTFEDGTTEETLRVFEDKKSIDSVTETTPLFEIDAEDLIKPQDDMAPQTQIETPEKTGKAPLLADLPVAPFYLSAKEYNQYRGGGSQEQVILQYSVTRERLDRSDVQISTTATLILGDDFAAMSNAAPGEPETLRIYDFKLDRLLNLEPDDKGLKFSSSSLYASSHRNTRLIGMMTDKGTRDDIDFGKGITLPAFWLESAMSFGAADRIEDIALEIDGRTVTATFGDEITTQITLSDQAFESDGMSNSQLVFAHHYWPVHPTVLRQIYQAPGPIESLTYIARGPDDLKGTKFVWTLTGQKAVATTFPLPVLAQSITDMDGAPLLAVNLRKTLTASAPDLDDLREPFLNADSLVDAWKNGQRYVTYSGDCAMKNRPELCNDITDIANDPDLDAAFAPIAKAANQAKTKTGRIEALPVLAKAASASDADPAILYLAGMTRARSKASDLSPQMKAFNAEAALTRAVNADPHNPSYLMGLAQYYAANDRFEEAWDLYDTLAIVLAQPAMEGHNIRLPIARVESGLRDMAPAYFLPK